MYGFPEATLRMKVPTVEHVELFCDLPIEAFLTPLSYNVALILLCAIFGFLTRKLPENFNESWYIFVSVSTTTFLWVAFLPTYYTTFYAYNQAALLAFCLFLNASITLLCLFIPKIYALYFVNEDRITFSFDDSRSTGSTNLSTNMPRGMSQKGSGIVVVEKDG